MEGDCISYVKTVEYNLNPLIDSKFKTASIEKTQFSIHIVFV